MPNVYSKFDYDENNRYKEREPYRSEPPPPIPLEPGPPLEPKKGESLKMPIKANPADPHSEEYSITVPYFSIGTPEQWLKWIKIFNEIKKGQNLMTASALVTLARQLLRGDALRVFNNKANELFQERTPTTNEFTQCMQAVTKDVFPERALIWQKRAMRRIFKKPQQMTVRYFANRLCEVNDYLPSFPPFKEFAKLSEEELTDILEYGFPHSWKKEMLRTGFFIADHTFLDVREYGERLEVIEGFGVNPSDKNKSHQGRQPGGRKQSDADNLGPQHLLDASRRTFDRFKKKEKFKWTTKYCPLHKTASHDIGECKTLISQAKKMRSSWYTARGTP